MYEDISYLYIVNGYYAGGNLIERMQERGKLFTESEACDITRMILEGLWHVRVSCKIAHLDGNLKASNILFTTSNDNDLQIKITHFGMNEIIEPMREMMGNSIRGSDYRISSMNLNNNNKNNSNKNNRNKNSKNNNGNNERRYRNRNSSSHGYYRCCEPYSLDMWSLGFTPFGVDTTEYYGCEDSYICDEYHYGDNPFVCEVCDLSGHYSTESATFGHFYCEGELWYFGSTFTNVTNSLSLSFSVTLDGGIIDVYGYLGAANSTFKISDSGSSIKFVGMESGKNTTVICSGFETTCKISCCYNECDEIRSISDTNNNDSHNNSNNNHFDIDCEYVFKSGSHSNDTILSIDSGVFWVVLTIIKVNKP